MQTQGRKNHLNKESAWGIFFIAPLTLLFFCFFFIPLFMSIYTGFTDWNVLSPDKNFVGLKNFMALLSDIKFWKAVRNTFYMLLPIPFYMIFALLFAMACDKGIMGNKVFRVMFYLPYISSIVALVIMWQWLFNSEYGLINHTLNYIFGIKGPNWLGDPKWIKRTIVIMIAWKLIGITSIYYMAALKKIPKDYYEAAMIDGARPYKKFFSITLPMLSPTTFYLAVVGVIGSLQTFVEVQLFTTDGGRNYSVATIVYFIWQKAFQFNEMGYACSAAILFSIFILLITLIQFKVSKRWVFDGE